LPGAVDALERARPKVVHGDVGAYDQNVLHSARILSEMCEKLVACVV
jgi:hypothetical protein